MGFRLVPKSVTLNDLERRKGPCFALFHRMRVRCRRKKFTFAISSPDEVLVRTDGTLTDAQLNSLGTADKSSAEGPRDAVCQMKSC